MPFDEEEDQEDINQKITLKKVSSQKSIFDSMPKKPSAQDFEKKIKFNQEKSVEYQSIAAELSAQFDKIMADKTLRSNKNIFSKDLERDFLKKMLKFASDANNDGLEKEGEGSLAIMAALLRHSLLQRDRINNLEYMLTQLEKKLEPGSLSGFVSKEIKQVLDKKKDSE